MTKPTKKPATKVKPETFEVDAETWLKSKGWNISNQREYLSFREYTLCTHPLIGRKCTIQSAVAAQKKWDDMTEDEKNLLKRVTSIEESIQKLGDHIQELNHPKPRKRFWLW